MAEHGWINEQSLRRILVGSVQSQIYWQFLIISYWVVLDKIILYHFHGVE